MHPPATDAQTVLATCAARRHIGDLVEVSTRSVHGAPEALPSDDVDNMDHAFHEMLLTVVGVGEVADEHVAARWYVDH